ncbi:MAG TPA: hypothetical protein VL793_00265, partial [Patescibacteria group bacterium]|nr:hypothetical protein [Patescibacteria group bacterium]
ALAIANSRRLDISVFAAPQRTLNRQNSANRRFIRATVTTQQECNGSSQMTHQHADLMCAYWTHACRRTEVIVK